MDFIFCKGEYTAVPVNIAFFDLSKCNIIHRSSQAILRIILTPSSGYRCVGWTLKMKTYSFETFVTA
jgi:hypothetical protein